MRPSSPPDACKSRCRRPLSGVCKEEAKYVGDRATKDLVLPLSQPVRGKDGRMISEIVVPRGTVVLGHFQASNSSKELWGEDAGEWKPGRWLSPPPAALEEAHLQGVYANL